MPYTVIRNNNDGFSTLMRDQATGAPVLSVRRARGAADYEDYYRLSDCELDHFLKREDALSEFAEQAERRLLEERLVRAATDGPPRAPRTKSIYLSRSTRYSLDRDADTGQALFSIVVGSSAVEYEEWYRISEDELRLLLGHPELAEAFAKCCGRREFDDRLVLKPGTMRGHFTG
jgi:hypothetical protein